MLIRKAIEITQGRRPIKDVFYYFQGNWRYKIYYSPFKFLLRKHILQQIDYRIKWMDQECFNEGSCKLCGCETTALQMCNKSCDKPCYPPMMNKEHWSLFNDQYILVAIKGLVWHKNIVNDAPEFFEIPNIVDNETVKLCSLKSQKK